MAQRPNGAWATAQLVLALTAIGWAVVLFLFPGPQGKPTTEFPREILYSGITLAGGLFLFVAFILFARGHPDARIVAGFGIAMFAIINVFLILNRKDVTTTCVDTLGNPHPCSVQGDRLGAMIWATASITVLEVTLLVTSMMWDSRERRRLELEKREAEWAGDAPRRA